MTVQTEFAALSLTRGVPHHVALVTDDGELTYDDIRGRVEARRDELGSTRRLVMIEAAMTVEPVITYLASLEAGHPVLLVEPASTTNGQASRARIESLVSRFDPDVIAVAEGDHWGLNETRTGTRHELHPDLAMLATTSGSTGSPKVVRLSRENLLSNASAISQYLELDVADRAMTTLPLHYCYGLSVLNSHLFAGASVRLSSRSVLDSELWNDFEAAQATSFAGVPHTFELLEKTDFATRDLSSLRYITQAGGRLDPERARRFIQLGHHRGFDFITMYGQTEATARMAYVPSDLAETAIGTIGIPIPGGQFRIDAPAHSDVGELVYTGPNVMMGYGEQPADLALGITSHELFTGDLARQRDDGLYEIVGRSNRFTKIFGLRIDLDHVEQLFESSGLDVKAVSSDGKLILLVTTAGQAAVVAEHAVSRWGLPSHVVEVHSIAEIPRTSSGKTDTVALLRYASDNTVDPVIDDVVTAETLRTRIAYLLGAPHAVIGDSFAGLGGDSLSFVEVAIHLEELLGTLPRAWPTMSMIELAAHAVRPLSPLSAEPASTSRAETHGPVPLHAQMKPATRRPWQRLPRIEAPIVLRAVAIVLIVATHADLIFVQGGSHLLLVIAGYNLARFQLANRSHRLRTRAMLAGVASVAIPAITWIGIVGVITGTYATATVFLGNNFVGSAQWTPQWHYWFLEAMLWSMLAVVALLAIPAARRWERRWPFAFALAVLALTLIVRTAVLGGVLAEGTEKYAVATVAWCIALGWVIARITTRTQRLLVSALAIVCVVGFFGQPLREAIVIGGVLVLLWVTSLPMPRWLVGVVSAVAGASFFIYLIHWQIYPGIETHSPLLATVISLIAGVVVWKAYTFSMGRGRALFAKAFSTTPRTR
ncbi:AMP-binding protein [Salinibacterium sp. TMP30]|uniref:AMP-binding protein n=1 Tax=Salinibacterium sp. TMP30 TaxID=3138237 RepID=UPI0031387991